MMERFLSMNPNLLEINSRQVCCNSRQAGLLPAGYTLVSGSSSRRICSRKQFPSGFRFNFGATHPIQAMSSSRRGRPDNQCSNTIYAAIF
jgi:hypothetical protein